MESPHFNTLLGEGDLECTGLLFPVSPRMYRTSVSGFARHSDREIAGLFLEPREADLDEANGAADCITRVVVAAVVAGVFTYIDGYTMAGVVFISLWPSVAGVEAHVVAVVAAGIVYDALSCVVNVTAGDMAVVVAGVVAVVVAGDVAVVVAGVVEIGIVTAPASAIN